MHRKICSIACSVTLTGPGRRGEGSGIRKGRKQKDQKGKKQTDQERKGTSRSLGIREASREGLHCQGGEKNQKKGAGLNKKGQQKGRQTREKRRLIKKGKKGTSCVRKGRTGRPESGFLLRFPNCPFGKPGWKPYGDGEKMAKFGTSENYVLFGARLRPVKLENP